MLKYEKGEIVTLKKPHACGVNEWEIFQTGIDIKLKCRGCGRLIDLPRIEFERRVRKILEQGKWISILNRE